MTIQIKIDRDRYSEHWDMIEWCQEEFSEIAERNGLERWGIDSAFGTTWFYFRDETDATLFTLRWL